MSSLLLIQNENKILKKELEEKDKNLILAAQYGNTLLEQNADLHTKTEKIIQECEHKVEKFQQENYSLSMKLEAKDRIVMTLASEIEGQEKLYNERTKALTQKLEGEIAQFRRKESSNEKTIESLQGEIAIHKEKLDNLQNLLEQTQKQQQETSLAILSESGLGECTLELENQINSLRNDKQNLEKDALELKAAFKSANLKATNKQVKLERTLVELEEKECQLTTLFNEVERAKRENEELRMEIDQMKYAETDPRKKGNSLFAEVEDNRQTLEKRVISMSSKFATVKKQCEVKTQQIAKLKLHIASLLNMTTNRSDLQYQQHLEDSLTFTKDQLNNIVLKYKELEEQLLKQSIPHNGCDMNCLSKMETDNYLKHLYDESLAKVTSLEEDLRHTCFTKISLNDKILQLTRKLHQSEREMDSNRAEIIRLHVKIEEASSTAVGQVDSSEPDKEAKVPVFIERLSKSEHGKENGTEKSLIQEGALKERYIAVDVKRKLRANDFSDGNFDLSAAKPLAELIPTATQKTFPSKDAEKENESPDFVKENFRKLGKKINKVNFAGVENEETKESCAVEKTKMSKLRKKMEAPHIKVTQNSKEPECKVQ